MLAAILGRRADGGCVFRGAAPASNHFRAIFAEGAFQRGVRCRPTRSLHGQSQALAKTVVRIDRIFTLLFSAQLVLLVLALLFIAPQVIAILAPGFSDDPARGKLAIELTRITFPYLLLITAE